MSQPPQTIKKRKSYVSKLKLDIFKFFAAFVFSEIFISIGVFVFFYLDQCYDVVMLDDPQKQYHQLCQYIESNHTFTLQNDSKIQEICQESRGYKPETIECKFDLKTGFKYFDLATSIGFTIGYGRVLPVSDAAKIFFMLYAAPIIAVNMTVYVFCGEIVTSLTEIIVDTVRKRCFNCFHKRSFHTQKSLLLLINTLLLLTALSSVHKSVYPETTWLICFYYCMATVSTVGFGDVSYNSYEYFKAGSHFTVLSGIFFLLSMGTLASTINIINQSIVRRGAKMTKIANRSLRKRRTKTTGNTPSSDGRQNGGLRFSDISITSQENIVKSTENVGNQPM